jgi:ankyrin repeat protein
MGIRTNTRRGVSRSRGLVELLIVKGVDVNAKTSSGQTPLQLAENRRNKPTIELLRRRGVEK